MAPNIIQSGDAPALLFIPGPVPPGTTIPQERILLVANPFLYLLVRDIVRDGYTEQVIRENNKAGEQLLEELLKYRPKRKKNDGVLPMSVEELEDQFDNDNTYKKEH